MVSGSVTDSKYSWEKVVEGGHSGIWKVKAMLESPEFIALSFYSSLIKEIEIDFVLRELR